MYLLQLYHAAFIIQFELPFFSPFKKTGEFSEPLFTLHSEWKKSMQRCYKNFRTLTWSQLLMFTKNGL